MTYILKADDFPVKAIRERVYAKTMFSPICTAATDALAKEIADRLNQSDIAFPCVEEFLP